MGKPSSTQLSKNTSSHSIKTTMSKEKLVVKMSGKQRRRHHLKTQKSINKLFKQLRENSQSSLNASQISQTSIIDLDDSDTTLIPDQIRNRLQTSDIGTSIVIPDDDKPCSILKSFSLHTSTPKKTKSETLNETKQINPDSFLTIDLTAESGLDKSERSEPTVIDLVSTTKDDDTLVSAGCSTSHSEVTVIRQPVSRRMSKLKHGIANLNTAEKEKLLELITQTIFNGCQVPPNVQASLPNIQKSLPRVPETAEDTYIKEVILGNKASNTSVGSNVYHPDRQHRDKQGLRMVVIDGSNVAMEHGRGKFFSVRGLQICIDFFLRRGHVVKAFVPRFRCKSRMSSDPRLLDSLERNGLVIYTPSREVKGKTITSYDDRYIVQCAAEFDAVIVSGDNYRDIANENPKWRSVIETRLLPFTWVDDMIMFPKDPLGRYGPTLEQFLKHPPINNNVFNII